MVSPDQSQPRPSQDMALEQLGSLSMNWTEASATEVLRYAQDSEGRTLEHFHDEEVAHIVHVLEAMSPGERLSIFIPILGESSKGSIGIGKLNAFETSLKEQFAALGINPDLNLISVQGAMASQALKVQGQLEGAQGTFAAERYNDITQLGIDELLAHHHASAQEAEQSGSTTVNVYVIEGTALPTALPLISSEGVTATGPVDKFDTLIGQLAADPDTSAHMFPYFIRAEREEGKERSELIEEVAQRREQYTTLIQEVQMALNDTGEIPEDLYERFFQIFFHAGIKFRATLRNGESEELSSEILNAFGREEPQALFAIARFFTDRTMNSAQGMQRNLELFKQNMKVHGMSTLSEMHESYIDRLGIPQDRVRRVITRRLPHDHQEMSPVVDLDYFRDLKAVGNEHRFSLFARNHPEITASLETALEKLAVFMPEQVEESTSEELLNDMLSHLESLGGRYGDLSLMLDDMVTRLEGGPAIDTRNPLFWDNQELPQQIVTLELIGEEGSGKAQISRELIAYLKQRVPEISIVEIDWAELQTEQITDTDLLYQQLHQQTTAQIMQARESGIISPAIIIGRIPAARSSEVVRSLVIADPTNTYVIGLSADPAVRILEEPSVQDEEQLQQQLEKELHKVNRATPLNLTAEQRANLQGHPEERAQLMETTLYTKLEELQIDPRHAALVRNKYITP